MFNELTGICSVSPSAPEDLLLEDVGESWIVLSWFQIHDIELVTQIVLVTGGGIERNITVDGEHTTVNVTDLLPGNMYIIRIIAVASDGQSSPRSAALVASTRSRVSGMYVGLVPGLLSACFMHTCMCQELFRIFLTVQSPQGCVIIHNESILIIVVLF